MKIPPTMVINPTDDAKCMQEEMFGPILPIVTYRSFDDTIDYINSPYRLSAVISRCGRSAVRCAD